MVMRRNMMRRNLRRSIVKSLGRYIAIAMIIALGAGIFVGLRSTNMDMVATGQAYTDAQNMFDLRLLSTYGWDKAAFSPYLTALRQEMLEDTEKKIAAGLDGEPMKEY